MKDTFFLNDVQYAFLIGRGKKERLCGVSCHIILGYKAEKCNEEKLKNSWCRLPERHIVLCSEITPDGMVLFSDNHRPEKFFYKTEAENETEAENYINSLKVRLMDIENGEILALHYIKMPKYSLIIFEADCTAFDVTSLQIFIRDMAAMYCEKEDILPKLPDNFFPYGEESYPSFPRSVRKADKAYWSEKVKAFGYTPFKDMISIEDYSVPAVYENHKGIIDSRRCKIIKDFAQKNGFRTEDILLALFTQSVSKVTGKKHFILNIPVLDRSGVNPSFFNTAADYTDIIMYDANTEHYSNFSEYVREVSEAYKEYFGHRAFSGIKVQQIYSEYNRTDAVIGNVTFSSHIHIDINDKIIKQAFGNQYLIYTETPNVIMDSEFFRSGNHIIINLSTPHGYIPDGTENKIISAIIEETDRLSSYN